jgi:DNA polymerase-3 subunit delta
VDYLTFLRSAERGQPPPVALLHGADAQLLDDALRAASRAMAPDPSLAVFDRDVFDGPNVEVDTVVSAALTLPVQATFRLVVVRRCQALASRGADTLTRYVAGANPSACLLLLADEPLGVSRERKNPHWLLEVVPAAAVVELPARRGRAQEDWLRQRAASEGLTISEEAARLLVQWVGDDSAALLGEARKAALAGGPANANVGVNEVTAVVGEHRLSGIFDLTRAIERRELGLALRTLERVLAVEDAMLVLATLGREARTALLVQEWRARGQSVDQIARTLRRPPGAVEAVVAATAGHSVRSLANRLEQCWRAEWRLKSGGDARAELSALVAELASAG